MKDGVKEDMNEGMNEGVTLVFNEEISEMSVSLSNSNDSIVVSCDVLIYDGKRVGTLFPLSGVLVTLLEIVVLVVGEIVLDCPGFFIS